MKNNPSYHIPVLLNEVLEYLFPVDGGVYVDGTLGGGGHAEAILERIGDKGKLIGIDQDKEAIKVSNDRLRKYGERVILVDDNFVSIKDILFGLNIKQVDGIFLDLGVSSHQLDTPERGFSFGPSGLEEKLDMRMNQDQQLSAYDVVNFYPEKELKRIFFEFGEEANSAKIAHGIILARDNKKIETCGQLVEVIRRNTSPEYRFSKGHGHWANKIFRAIRMEVNQELPVLQEVLPIALSLLKPDGRLVVISFHSLEDRLVKHQFLDWQKTGLVEILTPQPIETSPEEVATNPKSASAKLRAVKKI